MASLGYYVVPNSASMNLKGNALAGSSSGGNAYYSMLDTNTGSATGLLQKAKTGNGTKTKSGTPTYDTFLKAAKNAGLQNSFDQNDLDLAKKYPEYGLSLVNLKKKLANATTNEQRLLGNEAINQLRTNYGTYWTGEEGNRTYAAQYGSAINDLLKKINDYGPFEYSGKDKYQELLDKVTNFEYNPETDQNFQSYHKQYAREGDRAAANALATAAAATGGVPSSYAATAAGQQANYYASKLADAIPELRAQAMTELLQGLGAMDTQRNQEYTEYGDTYNRMNQSLGNYQKQDDTYYKRYLDQINADYQKQKDADAKEQQEWQNAWDIYVKTGKVTGPLKKVLKETKSTSSGGGGGGGGSSGGGGGGGGSGGSGTTNTNTNTNKTNTTKKAPIAKRQEFTGSSSGQNPPGVVSRTVK